MNILTVDVEDWFHVLDNSETAKVNQWERFPSRLEISLERILDSFDRNGVKGTFFILGWIARVYPDAVAEIARRGHEIASHSDMHQLVYTQTPKDFEKDLVRSLDAIEAATGTRPTAYRAPGFSITENCKWAFPILARNGILQDCSIFPSQRAHGGFPKFPQGGPCIIENSDGSSLQCFPINLGTFFRNEFVFSGGGYFRLLPKHLLRHLFEDTDYVMTYFHPRDFDPDQPIIPGLSHLRRFKSYVGLSRALPKLEILMRGMPFTTLANATSQINWANVSRVAM